MIKKYNKVVNDLQGTKTPCQQKTLSYQTYLIIINFFVFAIKIENHFNYT